MNTITFALHLRTWGISSVGRALAWHARGHRFESVILHDTHNSLIINELQGRKTFSFLHLRRKGFEKNSKPFLLNQKNSNHN